MIDRLYNAFLKDRIWHFVSYQEFSETFENIEAYERVKVSKPF